MNTPTLSVIIPAYNESNTIVEILDPVRKVSLNMSKEIIIVVDDASVDGTPQLVEKYNSDEVKLLVHSVNQGKGAAIRTGIAAARGEYVLIQDADLEYHPKGFPLLLEPLREGEADVVFGNLFHGSPHRVLYFWHYMGNRALTFMTNIFTGLNLSDMEVGYKVFRASVLRQLTLKSNRFGFEPEITIKVAKLGCRVYEVPISYYGRTYSQGKKTTWRDGVARCFISFDSSFSNIDLPFTLGE
jgi:glycosyltransferase involved in cell wall biosynthesis